MRTLTAIGLVLLATPAVGAETVSLAPAASRTAEGAASVVTVVRSGDVSAPLDVRVLTLDDGGAVVGAPATAGVDYTPVATRVRFDAGVASRTVAIPTIADALDEPDEDIAVVVAGPDPATLAAQHVVCGATGASAPSNSGTLQAVAADFNGDGIVDLAAVNSFDDSVTILIDRMAAGASVVATTAVDVPAGTMPESLAAADFDGDGRPDLAVQTNWDGRIGIFRNGTAAGAATATFAHALDVPVGAGAGLVDVAAVDLDGDGRPDLAVAHGSRDDANQERCSVARNTSTPGAISFAPAQELPIAGISQRVRIVDVDGDGRPDVLANGYATISLLRNLSAPGGGALDFAPYQEIATGVEVLSFALGDLDGDGRPDLVVVDYERTMVLMKNVSTPGHPAFGAAHAVTLPANFIPRDIAIADLTRDGKADLAVTSNWFDEVALFANVTPSGGATPLVAPPVFVAVGRTPAGVVAADLDRDGVPDLAVACSNDHGLSVLLSRPTGPALSLPDNLAIVTIADDDPPPSASAALADGTIAEGGGTTLTVTLSAPSGRAVTAAVAVTGDYPGDIVVAGDIVIPPGALSASTRIDAPSDWLQERDESLVVVVSFTNTTTAAQTLPLSVLDRTPPPRVGLSPATAELREGAQLLVTAFASLPTTRAPHLHLAYDGPIAGPLDVQLEVDTAGVGRAASFVVTATEDSIDHGDVAAAVRLVAADGCDLGPTTTIAITVHDDDHATPPSSSPGRGAHKGGCGVGAAATAAAIALLLAGRRAAR